MKPDCDNEKCWNNDVEYEGACSIHIHKSCDDYIHKTQEIKDIENIEKAVHGKLYTIDCITDSIDYESGIVDDWHLRLVGPLDEEVLKQKNKILTFQ